MAAFRKTDQIDTHPPLFISVCLCDYLLTNILCRREQKIETSRFLHHGHFWFALCPNKNISAHIYFPACAVVRCVFIKVVVCHPQKHPSEGKVFTLLSKRTPGLYMCICESCCIYSPSLLQSALCIVS